MAKETLTVEIRAQADKAINEMRKFNDAAKKSAERVGRLTKLAKAYWAEALIAIAVVRKLTQAIKSITRAFFEDEIAGALLNSTLKATGIWTQKLSNQLMTYGEEMQKVTRYSKAQVWEAQGIVATFTQIGTDIYPRVIESAMNMSEVFGQDLKQSIIQLSKAINDPRMVENLQRIGVTMSQAQIEMIDYNIEIGNVAEAQRIILEELELEMGNVARTAGQTLGGQVEIVKNQFNELKGEIGALAKEGGVMEAYIFLASVIIEQMLIWTKALQELIGTNKAWRKEIQAMSDRELKNLIAQNDERLDQIAGEILALEKVIDSTGKLSRKHRQAKKQLEVLNEEWWELVNASKAASDQLGVLEEAQTKVTKVIEETVEALQDLNELVTVWSHKVAQMGLDASFYTAEQERMKTGIDEITEAMKEGDEVIMTYTEHIGLLSEQIHDLTDLKGELAKQEKENMDILNEQMSTYFPMWSQMFAELGDSTISAAEAMGKALKNMVADYLMSLSKQAFAEALLMIAKLRIGRAALFFAASAAAATGAGFVRSLAEGGQFVTTGPEIIQVGERGSERVTVEPIADINNSVTMPLTIQFGHQTIKRELQYQLDNEGVVIHRRIIV